MPQLEQDTQTKAAKDVDYPAYDYAHVTTVARVAVYDDMKMAPHIIEVMPAPTSEFIESLTTIVNDEQRKLGGSIPYTAIREVTENFIHAQFSEIVVSILDRGNTIRFCDQGPGILDKGKALRPGFTSATEQMKPYIRGVGSGLPIVKEYLDVTQGSISIEDNIEHGSVVTISLKNPTTPAQATKPAPLAPIPFLKPREQTVLMLFATEGALGVKDVSDLADIPQSSTFNILKHFEELGLIERTAVKSKRLLTDYGLHVSQQIDSH